MIADLSRSARLTTTVNKDLYRLGELIDVEITLRSVSSKPPFRRIATAEVYATDNRRRKVSLNEDLTVEKHPTAQSFQLLQKAESSKASVRIRLGCDERAFKEAQAIVRGGDHNKQSNAFLLRWGLDA